MRIDTGSLSLFGVDLSKTWQWWLSGLEQILPAGWQSFFLRTPPLLVIEQSESGLVLSLQKPAGKLQLCNIPPEIVAVAEPGTLRRYMPQGVRLDRLDVVLVLPSTTVLVRRISLPSAARMSLLDSVRYQLSRLTPFAPGQVYFDARVATIHQDAQELEVDVLVAPRQMVDPVLEDVQSALGLPITRASMVVEDDVAPFNLLQGHVPGRRWWRRLNVNAYLALALVIALLAAAIVPVIKQRALVVERKQELLELNARAADLKAKMQGLDDQLSLINFMAARRQSVPTPTATLAELTRLIPASAYVNSFVVRDGAIELGGVGNGVVDLIDIINSSPLFEGARFSAPLSRDPRSGLDQFRIALKFRAPAKEPE